MSGSEPENRLAISVKRGSRLRRVRRSKSAPGARDHGWPGVWGRCHAGPRDARGSAFPGTTTRVGRPVRFNVRLRGSLQSHFPDGRSSRSFEATGRLKVYSLETGQVYDLTDSAGAPPIWSPDGRFLAYLSRKADQEIAVTVHSVTITDMPRPLGEMAWNQGRRNRVRRPSARPISCPRVGWRPGQTHSTRSHA